MSKVCTSCGCVIENNNAKFCDECGAKFEISTTVKMIPTGVSGSGKLKISGLADNSSQKNFLNDDDNFSNTEPQPLLQEEKEQLQTVVLSEDDEDEEPLNPLPVEVESEISHSEVINDEDEEDNAEYELEEASKDNFSVIDDEEDEDIADFRSKDSAVSSSPKKKFFSFSQKETSLENVPRNSDMVTNDPYYDDVLPEINNEKVALQKDIIFKILAATAAMIAVIILLLYAFS